ncbi:Zn-ribbon domain-containing OB-fold protein [Bradyrhizobium iriomotense]|uniref:Zn-ribbon domain-containing OB-fold protein n=1 Tax=Bradyrhizobium iriomotense TaxID=441950 RepID=UPI001B8A0AE2|nr:Zn-ribbon domain-containing OB-fold protein [Bradyrhizobium iriomotense]MBR0784751.1 Zn-ribbon domain-containing OB-fold protein [Bradyrhizobium iriomotense]
MSKSRDIIAPTPSPETEEFWRSAREKRLALKYCSSCKKHHYYPRAICPHCFSDSTEWRDAQGEGTIHAFSVMRRAPVPYAVAYIELAEGPLMLSNLVNCDFNKVRIGQGVRLCFSDFEGGKLPVFEPL